MSADMQERRSVARAWRDHEDIPVTDPTEEQA